MSFLDKIKADLAATQDLSAKKDALDQATSVRDSAKSAYDSANTAKTAVHADAVAQAKPNLLYGPLDGGVFAEKIDGELVYRSPVDPATVADDVPPVDPNAPVVDPNVPVPSF